jgi:hypothetical protein
MQICHQREDTGAPPKEEEKKDAPQEDKGP